MSFSGFFGCADVVLLFSLLFLQVDDVFKAGLLSGFFNFQPVDHDGVLELERQLSDLLLSSVIVDHLIASNAFLVMGLAKWVTNDVI